MKTARLTPARALTWAIAVWAAATLAGCVNHGDMASARTTPAVAPAASAASMPQPFPVGGDRDSHGCVISAGYTWLESQKRCVRRWEMTPVVPQMPMSPGGMR